MTDLLRHPDPELSVNEVLVRWPSAVRALDAFGVDTCCGGTASLREAAAEADVPLDDLLVAIADVVGTAA